MAYRIKVTVIDKKLYPELQRQYCADPNAGPCPCYNVGDEFIFARDDSRDDFWHMGLNTLVKTNGDPNTIAGGPRCRTARKRGTQYRATSIPGCKGAPLCGDG